MEYVNDQSVICSFHRDGYEFLSNFYEAPVTVFGLTYRNNEAAFQAQKVLTDEEKTAFTVLDALRAKRLGRRVRLRPDWNEVRLDVMLECVRAKFSQNPELRERLLATGDALLVEGNSWNDTFWGVSFKTGKGENNLGKLLMRVRDELRVTEPREDEREQI